MENLLAEIIYRSKNGNPTFPDKLSGEIFIEELFNLLFLGGAGKNATADEVKESFSLLKKKFCELLIQGNISELKAEAICSVFFDNLELIYSNVLLDAKAILEFDPAAHSIDEVLHVYPGFYAIAIHRISHFLWRAGLTSLPRLFSEKAHSKTGIDIHPGAQIGRSFAIDHGTGIVIGETAVIGNNVKIYQGVTLGALKVSKENASVKRHPTIEDDVIIYGNATILGGATVIGRESIIGGNVWLTETVPPQSVVFHKSEIKIKTNTPFDEPINYII